MIKLGNTINALISCRMALFVGIIMLTQMTCFFKNYGESPVFESIDDYKGVVGGSLAIPISATDPEGESISYRYVIQIDNLDTRAAITYRNDGTALFQWNPIASDVGQWYIDFFASDGENETSVRVLVAIYSTIGGGTPVFRKPIGDGISFDLNQNDCLTIPVNAEDSNSICIALNEVSPALANTTFNKEEDQVRQCPIGQGEWIWCPSAIQSKQIESHLLRLTASDSMSPPTTKDYLIVLRGERSPNDDPSNDDPLLEEPSSDNTCQGTAPVITHLPVDQVTNNPLTIKATISDDKGLSRNPLLYYSLTPPAATPVLSTMTQLSMSPLSGTRLSAEWKAIIPNPVANSPAGTTSTVYYIIVADDRDSTNAQCNHTSYSPQFGYHSIFVIHPQITRAQGICEPCTTDRQCGGDKDLCVNIALNQRSYCLKHCFSSGDCPQRYTCSTGTISSVNRKSERQCLPDYGTCQENNGTGTVSCQDDQFEENDNQQQATMLTPGTQSALIVCPSDEDWYKITITNPSFLSMTINGDQLADLDAELVNQNGEILQSDTDIFSDIEIQSCLKADSYFLRVFANSFGERTATRYSIQYNIEDSTCDASNE